MWGATFVVVKAAVERVGVFPFNGVRFLLAAAVLGAFCVPRLRRLGARGCRDGGLLGVALFAGYAFQTLGLERTSASTTGFLTGMTVVFTPLLSALLLRRLPAAASLAGVALATVGLALLSLTAALRISGGDLLVLACAFSFAVHLVALTAWARDHDPLALTVVQLGVVGVLSLALAGTGWQRGWGDVAVAGALLITALACSAGAYAILTAAQRVVAPTRTAVILTMEPVFAGLTGFVVLGERLGARRWAGCVLILAGMLVAELAPSREREEALSAP